MRSPNQLTINILRWSYGSVFVIFGIDKFFNILTGWSAYVSPVVSSVPSLDVAAVLGVAGVVEIAIGLLIFFRTQKGGYMASGWLLLAVLNLASAGFYALAMKEVLLAVGAFLMGYLTQSGFEPKVKEEPEIDEDLVGNPLADDF